MGWSRLTSPTPVGSELYRCQEFPPEPSSLTSAPRRRAARRGAPPQCQRGTCDGLSLDDLVRPSQQRRQDRQAEGLRRLEVDDQLELRGLLDRQVAGSGTFQDLVHL